MFLPLVLFAFAQTAAPAAADATLPPRGTSLIATAEGRGAQIYHCALQGTTFAWIFDAPHATLYQPGTHTLVGTHTIGPTWTWTDGSSIVGTPSASRPAPQSSNLPWLLLKTHPVSTAAGTLGRVTWVRRSNTQGGLPPAAACDQGRQGTVQEVPYTATYTFFAGAADASSPASSPASLP